jgi:hypothetical protein
VLSRISFRAISAVRDRARPGRRTYRTTQAKSGTTPAKQGDGVHCPTQAQPQFGLMPAARMAHNGVANTRYNNLGDDDCAV